MNLISIFLKNTKILFLLPFIVLKYKGRKKLSTSFNYIMMDVGQDFSWKEYILQIFYVIEICCHPLVSFYNANYLNIQMRQQGKG